MSVCFSLSGQARGSSDIELNHGFNSIQVTADQGAFDTHPRIVY